MAITIPYSGRACDMKGGSRADSAVGLGTGAPMRRDTESEAAKNCRTDSAARDAQTVDGMGRAGSAVVLSLSNDHNHPVAAK